MASQKSFEGEGWESEPGKPLRVVSPAKTLVVKERVDGIRQGYWTNTDDLTRGSTVEAMRDTLGVEQDRVLRHIHNIAGWTHSSRGRRAAYLRGQAIRLMAGGRGEGAEEYVNRKIQEDLAAMALRPRPPGDMEEYEQSLRDGADAEAASINTFAAAAAVSQAYHPPEQSYYRGVAGPQAQEIVRRLLAGDEHVELGTFALTSVSESQAISERFLTHPVEGVEGVSSRIGVVVELKDIPRESIAISHRAFADPGGSVSSYNNTLRNESEVILMTEGGIPVTRDNVTVYLDGQEIDLDLLAKRLGGHVRPEAASLPGLEKTNQPLSLENIKGNPRIVLDPSSGDAEYDVQKITNFEAPGVPIVSTAEYNALPIKGSGWVDSNMHLAGRWMLEEPTITRTTLGMASGNLEIHQGNLTDVNILAPAEKEDGSAWEATDYEEVYNGQPNGVRIGLSRTKAYGLKVLPTAPDSHISIESGSTIESSTLTKVKHVSSSSDIRDTNIEFSSSQRGDISMSMFDQSTVTGRVQEISGTTFRAGMVGLPTIPFVASDVSNSYFDGGAVHMNVSREIRSNTFFGSAVVLRASHVHDTKFEITNGTVKVPFFSASTVDQGSKVALLTGHRRKNVAPAGIEPDVNGVRVLSGSSLRLAPMLDFTKEEDRTVLKRALDRYSAPPKDDGWGNIGSAALPSLYARKLQVDSSRIEFGFPHAFIEESKMVASVIIGEKTSEVASSYGTHFDGVDMRGSEVRGTFEKSVFNSIDAKGTSWKDVNLEGSSFINAEDLDLTGSKGEVKVGWTEGPNKDLEHLHIYKDGVFVEKRKIQTTPKTEEKPKENNG